MIKNLFLVIGAPGSGKTTDASIIAKNDNSMTHYSTGDMLRDEIATNSELGKEINSYTSKGNLVPIEIIIKTITNAIKNAPTQNVIIDGYPRSNEQMTQLDDYLSSADDVELKAVFEVEVSEETALQRVLGRNRGDDDSKEVFINRMKVYTKPLKEIQDFYKNKNLLININAENSIEQVVSDMSEKIQELINN